MTAESAAQLARAHAQAAAWRERASIAAEPSGVDSAEAIALGYLERHRLSLGSPFRLIDYALHDARLPDSTRRAVAWALLAHTLEVPSSEVWSGALDYVGTVERESARGLGWEHAAVIDSVIQSASDPRAGEEAVRLAYALATAERTTGPRAPLVSAQVAALARDRILASRDAEALLRTAEEEGSDPLSVIGPWRAARRFAVERPPLEPAASDVETALRAEAMRLAPRVLGRIRDIADRWAAGLLADPERHAGIAGGGGRTLLPDAAAQRLSELAAEHAAPPQAPVTVALRGYRQRLLATSDDADRRWRVRLLAHSRTEESLAAEHALVQARGAGGRAPALALLSAAVALRAYAQEEVWLPGMSGPTVTQVKDRLGLAAVSFDADVPVAWRPYYLRMFAAAVTDLQRVLPDLSLQGAGVHFGERAMRRNALALHDPATRTIHLPLESGAGVIAHELLHDLDWQAARIRFARRGGYSTDRAVREEDGRMAATLRGLTAAPLIPPMPENAYHPPHDHRPAELFARSADWFVAAALAREGRMNGYLTAVQDELLGGYASAAPPDAGGASGRATVQLLDDMTRIAAPARADFLARFGPDGRPSPYGIVRRVLTVPAIAPDAPDESRHAALDPRRLLPPRAACAPRADPRSAESLAHGLLVDAATARARGALGRPERIGGGPDPARAGSLAAVRDAVLFGIDSAEVERRSFHDLLVPPRARCRER